MARVAWLVAGCLLLGAAGYGMVGNRGGKHAVNWTAVLLATILCGGFSLGVGTLAEYLVSGAFPISPAQPPLVALVVAAAVGPGLVVGFRTPLDRLPRLD